MLLDIRRGALHELLFNSQSQALAPITLAGSPVVQAYIQGSDTQFTTGLTLTVDRDSITGANRVAIDTTDQTVWVPGNTFFIVLSAGTVDSISVAGRKIGSFSIEKAWDGRITQATAQGAAAQTIRLAAGEVGTDGFKLGDEIMIFTATTGAGQRRVIVASNGATSVADTVTLDRPWDTTPTGTIVYRRYASSLSSTVAEFTASIVSAVFARAFDATKMAGLTFEQIQGLMASVLLGKVSGMAGNAPVFRNPGDTANAVSAGTDANGNRTSVTLTTGSVA